MALAIQIAQAGAPHVSPNPLVGCVILDKDNKFLASGYHEKYGEAHAEINAIKSLKEEQLANATVYVTLEPCAHEGKTGSCAKKLAQYKLNKVVYGLTDPNPLVAGKGAQMLPAEEYQGKHKQDLEDLAEVFLKNFRENKTFVALKVASSLDGQIALKTGESQWITGPESREYVHELRSWYDAVLVGTKTIENDDPSLNIRHDKIKKENKVIILDPDARILKKEKYKFLEVHKKENVYFAVQNPVKSEYQTIVFKDLPHLMSELWKLNIKSIFVEGGATTHSSFLKEGLVDRLHLFMNTSVIGAGGGLSWTKDFSLQSLSEKLILKNVKTQIFGSDIYVTGKI